MSLYYFTKYAINVTTNKIIKVIESNMKSILFAIKEILNIIFNRLMLLLIKKKLLLKREDY